jgi:hypothetical protein
MCMYTFKYVYIYVCLYIFIYIYMYIFIVGVFSESLNQGDAAYASGLIDDRPASFLGPYIYRLIYNLLTQPSTQQQLFRFQDNLLIDQNEEERVRFYRDSTQDLRSNRSLKSPFRDEFYSPSGASTPLQSPSQVWIVYICIYIYIYIYIYIFVYI